MQFVAALRGLDLSQPQPGRRSLRAEYRKSTQCRLSAIDKQCAECIAASSLFGLSIGAVYAEAAGHLRVLWRRMIRYLPRSRSGRWIALAFLALGVLRWLYGSGVLL